MAWAVLLFVVEPLVIMSHLHDQFGASLTAVFAAYVSFGWLLGAVVGIVSGVFGAAFRRFLRKDAVVPGVGPVLGFMFMAMFILRWETPASIKSPAGTVITSLVAAAFVWIGLWYLGRRFVARYLPSNRRRPALKLLALVAFITTVVPLGLSRVGSDRLPNRPAAPADSPNVVLIVVDALRPDHLSTYGYHRETSPNIDRLAENGVLFTNAYSHGNRTIIAMPSLFTSLYPSFHGAVGKGELMVPLPESRTTIAEMCRDAGYSTIGIMSNVYLKTPFGLTRGFDRVEEFETQRFRLSVYRAWENLGVIEKPTFVSGAPDAAEVTKRGIEWLRRFEDSPFFLFLHYMDVHHPYLPPAEYEQMFNSDGSSIDPETLFMKTCAMVAKPPPLRLPEAELRRLVDLYDGCIRYTDEEIGRFLRELESLELDRETVVIFTADHGDEFLEHGSLYHTNLTIEPLIRVPLIVSRFPAASDDRRDRSLVRHVDVLPTIAELTGATLPEKLHGTSLIPLLNGDHSRPAGHTIAEGDYCTSLNKGHWKLLHVDSTGTYQLFDLSVDPVGLNDVSESYPDKFMEMKSIVEEYLRVVAELQKEDAQPMSDDTVRQLRALGYIK